MTFIHGRFHHFPRHHSSWWPLHCYTLHNTLIESNRIDVYKFICVLQICYSSHCLHAQPYCSSLFLAACVNSFFLSPPSFSFALFTIQTRYMSISLPIRFQSSKAISIWWAACLNCIHNVGFYRYLWIWTIQLWMAMVNLLGLYASVPCKCIGFDVMPQYWSPKKCWLDLYQILCRNVWVIEQ